MPDKHVYEYSVIRLVPRVEREEFLNIGVIVFCKRQKYLAVKYHLDQERLALFSDTIDFTEVESYLQTWDLVAKGQTSGGPIAQLDQANRFRWLTNKRSTIIQPSPVHVGRCGEPDEVLERLFTEYVGLAP